MHDPENGICHYPAFLNLKRRPCLVVGGGGVAERKMRALLKTGARVVCLAESVNPAIRKLARNRKIRLVETRLDADRKFGPMIKDAFLVVAATSSSRLNEEIYEQCARRNRLVNVVDDPRHSTFIAPAVMRRGPLSIAVSTGGASPAFAKAIRGKLERLFGPEYGAFLKFMLKERSSLMNHLSSPGRRKKLFQDIIKSNLVSLFKKGPERTIRRTYESILKRHGILRAGQG